MGTSQLIMDLSAYMAESIRNIMATAYLNVLGNPHEARFVAKMQHTVSKAERRREQYKGMIFLSFPGDEKALDGCMAAGRGFFHIGPDGSAEPCPFSPFSDTNAARDGLRAALASPLFHKIRDARALGWEHTGGCTLYEHRDEVEALLQNK